VRKRQGVTYDMGWARALAEAVIREAAQVRNHPPDRINLVVVLNRAVAITERDGAEHGLAALEAIVGMERSHLWHAALADNLRRLGRAAEAAGSWKLPPHWRPPRENGGCLCLVSSM
jgi:RNA polymerase sigma-70 factor (ECF subfamily)